MSSRPGVLGVAACLFLVGGVAHSGGAWRMANELFVPKPEILPSPAVETPTEEKIAMVERPDLVKALSSLPLDARVAAMRALPKTDIAIVLVGMDPGVAQETAMAMAVSLDPPVVP